VANGLALKRRRAARWSVYVLRTRQGALYTGIALDVRRRLEQHAGFAPGGAKALRGKSPLRLELARSIGSRSLAQKVEWRIKRLSRARKLALLERRRLLDGLVREAASAASGRVATRVARPIGRRKATALPSTRAGAGGS